METKQLTSRIFLSLTLLSVSPQTQAHDATDIAIVAGIGIGVAGVATALGLYGYKLYEDSSIESAHQRVKQSTHEARRIESMYTEAAQKVHHDQDRTVLSYHGQEPTYHQWCRGFTNSVDNLKTMQHTTQEDIRSWQYTDKARHFINEAREFTAENEPRIQRLEPAVAYYENRKHLLALATMVDADRDPQGKLHALWNAWQNYSLASIAQTQHRNSSWPVLQACNEITTRTNSYVTALHNLQRYSYSSQQSLYYQNITQVILNDWEQVKNALTSLPEYTRDLNAKKQAEDQAELLRIEREKAAAAQRQAEAQERQARAQERQAAAQRQQIIETKKTELAQLEKELTTTAEYSRRHAIQNRINTLKYEISWSWYAY